MAMPITVPRYTIHDLESFPDDGNRYELLDGVLLVTPAPALTHQLIVSRLFGELHSYLRQRAVVFTPGCIQVEPNVHLEPDLLVVPAEELSGVDEESRWTSIKQWWLAVEVSGESRFYDRDYKTPAYLSLGVREVWRVDLRERRLFVSVLGKLEQPQTDTVRWLPPGSSEALHLSVPQLFA